MFGGNDSNNMVLATDTDSWGRYFSARNTGQVPIALMPVGTAITPPARSTPSPAASASPLTSPRKAWGGVLPIASDDCRTRSRPAPTPPRAPSA